MSAFMDFLQYPFLFKALISGLLLATLCGVLSPMIVAKKFAFMGASISHGALLGVAIGLSFLTEQTLMSSVTLFFVTLGVTLLAVSPLAWYTFRQRLPSDALIGLFFTATMGLGLIIHQASGSARGDLLGYLFGNILTLSSFDIALLTATFLITLPLIYVYRWQWMIFLFDEESAFIQGVSTRKYHLFLFLMLTLVIVAGLKLSGVILINSFLLIPGIFALKWAPNARSTFTYSIVFALKSTVLGLFLANLFNLPMGATLAVTQVALYFLSFLFKYKK
ncbi:MAG: metal ABC transporter permease [Halobacteriovoraceae bacterium]|nr:metal ABC transporter permease [Halobacteriovoraceae bacterium]